MVLFDEDENDVLRKWIQEEEDDLEQWWEEEEDSEDDDYIVALGLLDEIRTNESNKKRRRGSIPGRINVPRDSMDNQQASPTTQRLAKSWRTIKELKSLDPEEYDEETMFLCRVTLIDIDCTKGWCYLGCDTCQKSMCGAPRKYKCGRCGPIKRPIQWYKLKAQVQDATGTMDLMIFCEEAEKLVGVSAEDLVDKIKKDDDWYTLPSEVSRLLGSTHTFQVGDKYGYGSFSVKSIMDHVNVPVPTATKGKGKKKRVPAGSTTAAEARPKSNKRLRGDDWTD